MLAALEHASGVLHHCSTHDREGVASLDLGGSRVSCLIPSSIFMHTSLRGVTASFLQEYEKALAKLERLERSSAGASKSEAVCWDAMHEQRHQCSGVACGVV